MEERGYIAPLNDKVGREHVTFRNRYGIALAGDLYTAKDIEPGKRYPALIVGAPYGGVKEQGPCVYAGELAQQGFIVLTFDAPFMGESEGNPRHTSGPEMFSESFSAAVDWLGLQETVDRERIGAIGICGSGAFCPERGGNGHAHQGGSHRQPVRHGGGLAARHGRTDCS